MKQIFPNWDAYIICMLKDEPNKQRDKPNKRFHKEVSVVVGVHN